MLRRPRLIDRPCIGVVFGLCSLAGCSNLPPQRPEESTEDRATAARHHEKRVEKETNCRFGADFTADECKTIAAFALPESLPPAAGNHVGDDPGAARFGFFAFFDRRFSNIPQVSCATCHQPEHSFTDANAVPEVVPGRKLPRNSPTILNTVWMAPHYFWDGRADSLWSQPLFAIEHPDEMASTRLELAHSIHSTKAYRKRYEQLFGPLPDLSDKARFPERGKPGDEAFDRMADVDREAVNRIAANFGKVLEAYMRKVTTGASKLDRYLKGDSDALSAAEQRGLRTFVRKGCANCHSGPALSDGAFHAMYPETSDRGRAAAIEIVRDNPFNARGDFFDEKYGKAPPLPDPPGPADEGAFRTPSLRNVALTAPYGHDGRYTTLADVLRGLHPQMTEPEVQSLVVFLLALNGDYPERPWSDWPAR